MGWKQRRLGTVARMWVRNSPEIECLQWRWRNEDAFKADSRYTQVKSAGIYGRLDMGWKDRVMSRVNPSCLIWVIGGGPTEIGKDICRL